MLNFYQVGELEKVLWMCISGAANLSHTSLPYFCIDRLNLTALSSLCCKMLEKWQHGEFLKHQINFGNKTSNLVLQNLGRNSNGCAILTPFMPAGLSAIRGISTAKFRFYVASTEGKRKARETLPALSYAHITMATAWARMPAAASCQHTGNTALTSRTQTHTWNITLHHGRVPSEMDGRTSKPHNGKRAGVTT